MPDDLFSTPPPKEPKKRKPSPAPVTAPAGPPANLEYTPLGATEKWLVEIFGALATEFEFQAQEGWPAQMARFQEVAQRYERGWSIVRKLYGIGPVILPAAANPDEFRLHSRAEVCSTHGVDPAQLQTELDAIRGLWRAARHLQEPGAREGSDASALPPPPPSGEIQFESDILEEFGFPDKLFEVKWQEPTRDGTVTRHRDREENRRERDWFARRVRELAVMLRESRSAPIARSALLNELHLRRYEIESAGLPPGNDRHNDLIAEQRKIEKTLAEQLESLDELFPEFGGTAKKVGFKGCLHDVIKGYMDYHQRQDARLIDRVRTAAEIEVELRQSLQDPNVRYRLGQTVFVVEAIAGLWDPEWKSQLKQGALKKIDAAGKAAIDAVRLGLNEPLLDLEQPGSEYPPLAT
jgi:hypothetical protein